MNGLNCQKNENYAKKNHRFENKLHEKMQNKMVGLIPLV